MLDPPLSLFPSTIAIAISLLLLLPLAPPPRTWCWWYVHSMCASSSSCVRTGTPLSVGGATKGLSLSLSLPGWRRGASVCGQGRLLLLRSLLVFVRREGGFAHSRKGEREKGGETRREGGRETFPHSQKSEEEEKARSSSAAARSNRGRRGCGIESGKKREKGEKRERKKEKKRRFGLGEGGGQKRLCSLLLIASTVEAGVVEELFRFPPPSSAEEEERAGLICVPLLPPPVCLSTRLTPSLMQEGGGGGEVTCFLFLSLSGYTAVGERGRGEACLSGGGGGHLAARRSPCCCPSPPSLPPFGGVEMKSGEGGGEGAELPTRSRSCFRRQQEEGKCKRGGIKRRPEREREAGCACCSLLLVGREGGEGEGASLAPPGQTVSAATEAPSSQTGGKRRREAGTKEEGEAVLEPEGSTQREKRERHFGDLVAGLRLCRRRRCAAAEAAFSPVSEGEERVSVGGRRRRRRAGGGGRARRGSSSSADRQY